MDEKEFSTLYTNNLKINDLFAMNVSIIGLAAPIKDSIGDVAKASLALLTSSNTAMGEHINKSKKSAYTELITAANTDRSSWFSNIKNEITNAIKGRNESKKTAGKALKIFLEPYWNLNERALNTQTNNFVDMLDKYKKDETLKTHAATIGITDLFTGLETANGTFNQLYEARNSEQAAMASASATSFKPATVRAYENFCTAVEQAVNFIGGDTLTTLFNEMDVLRKKYALLIDKNNDDDDTTTNTPTDTTK